MSAYGKSQPPNLHAFDTARTFQESPYPFATPSYGSQAPVPTSTAAPVFQTAEMTQMAFPQSQGRLSYNDQAGPYLNVGSTPVPGVSSYAPSRGSRGTKFTVNITSLYELQTTNTPMFFLQFGRQKCSASLAKVGQQGAVCSYVVTSEVPLFGSTGWNSANVPVSLFMETGDGDDLIAKVDVGAFTYVDGSGGGGDPTQEMSRKRKLSHESLDDMRSPVKRPPSHQLRPKEEFNSYAYTAADGSGGYAAYMQPASNYGNLMPQIPQYSRPPGSYQGQAPRHLAYNYATSSTVSPPTIKAQSPQLSHWSPSYAGGLSMARSPAVPSNGAPSHASPLVANPPLIRTSTLQQTPSPSTTPHGGGQQFNAYALYPHKAKLEINGDLDSMTLHWSPDEWESKRRLVQFRRSQSGSTITTNFHALPADERQSSDVCISCIYWQEKAECFVTSVDTIYLLEQLVAARFTVEEKNRIRRNLEGFRPLTVSKGKPDSEEFFKVIMAFPNPKPRNIEKDVKVFHWKDLASALKKIIGKYSASPSSTLPPAPAPALLTPVSSTGYTTDSGAGLSYVSEHHGGLSPRSISGSTSSTAYSTIPARVTSPSQGQKVMTNLQSPPDHHHRSHPHGLDTAGSWQGPQHHMPPGPPQYQQQLSSQARASWDMTMPSYLDTGAANAGGSSNSQTSTQPPSQPQSGPNPGHHHQQQQQQQSMTTYPGIRNLADPEGNNRMGSQPQIASHQMSRT